VLVLSGGEPLLRPDIFDVARRARALGFYVALSSNGTLIDDTHIAAIAACEFDYVGISLDGLPATHDLFRQREGAFAAALRGLRLCRAHGLKTGMRTTLTRQNAPELPALLALAEREGIERFYLSHLNYAGRGDKNKRDDAQHRMTRQAMEQLFETALAAHRQGQERDFTTGNNDADGVYFLHWTRRRFPDAAPHIEAKLRQWGGNASGLNVANIDNLGNVHPDTMWRQHTFGNVRERSFGDLWRDLSDPLLVKLKQHPRAVQGRCGTCHYLDVCNGNTRIRALQSSGELWAEDPGCYLTDEEISPPEFVRDE
jgi:heme d1 biosynthesis radical SAM protein NirJ